MYHVYVLQSIRRHDRLYSGFTAREVHDRLRDHNDGKVDATKFYRPWRVVYFESYAAEDDARTREQQLKQYGSTWGHLKKRVKKSLEQGKGGDRSAELSSALAKGEK